MGILRTIAGSTPVVGQVMSLTKTATRVYSASNPTTAVIYAIEGVLIDCSPPVVKYPLKCLALCVQAFIVAGSISNPVAAPITVSILVSQIKQIVMEKVEDECTDLIL
jgi:hypothetical protein